MKSRLGLSWGVFLGTLIVFVSGVEILHKYRNKQNVSYQCRIVIDKDLAADEILSKEEDSKAAKPQLYERTSYGILPKKQPDCSKIFNAYASDVIYDPQFVKVAVIIDENSDLEKIQKIVDACGDTKVSFVIPYYLPNIKNVANAIITNGCEFFIQLPTTTSIPQDLKNKVSPFLANSNPQDLLDKLNYLISSAQYAIGIANVSETLITKSSKDMTLMMRELSQRGLAFLCIDGNDDVLGEISSSVKFINLKANAFGKESDIKNGDALFVRESQFEDFIKALPKNIKCVPISFKVKNASV